MFTEIKSWVKNNTSLLDLNKSNWKLMLFCRYPKQIILHRKAESALALQPLIYFN